MRAYHAADVNGDGFVRKSEFRRFLQTIVYYNQLWSLFESLDNNNDSNNNPQEVGDRRITKEEFEKAAASVLDLGDKSAGQVFDEMDTNKGGVVLFDELCEWMAKNNNVESLLS
jgi:Ca2+-binding EF-hand superfamily protein